MTNLIFFRLRLFFYRILKLLGHMYQGMPHVCRVLQLWHTANFEFCRVFLFLSCVHRARARHTGTFAVCVYPLPCVRKPGTRQTWALPCVAFSAYGKGYVCRVPQATEFGLSLGWVQMRITPLGRQDRDQLDGSVQLGSLQG